MIIIFEINIDWFKSTEWNSIDIRKKGEEKLLEPDEITLDSMPPLGQRASVRTVISSLDAIEKMPYDYAMALRRFKEIAGAGCLIAEFLYVGEEGNLYLQGWGEISYRRNSCAIVYLNLSTGESGVKEFHCYTED